MQEKNKALTTVAARTAVLEKKSQDIVVVKPDSSIVPVVDGRSVELIPVSRPADVTELLKQVGPNQRVVYATLALVPKSELDLIIREEGVHQILDNAQIGNSLEAVTDALRRSNKEEISFVERVFIENIGNSTLPTITNSEHLDSVTLEAQSGDAIVSIETERINQDTLVRTEESLAVEESERILGLVRTQDLETINDSRMSAELRRVIGVVDKASVPALSLQHMTPVQRLTTQKLIATDLEDRQN